MATSIARCNDPRREPGYDSDEFEATGRADELTIELATAEGDGASNGKAGGTSEAEATTGGGDGEAEDKLARNREAGIGGRADGGVAEWLISLHSEEVNEMPPELCAPHLRHSCADSLTIPWDDQKQK